VSGKDRRIGTRPHGGVEDCHPFIAIGMIKIALLHAMKR
jgi:hypothetical protein